MHNFEFEEETVSNYLRDSKRLPLRFDEAANAIQR